MMKTKLRKLSAIGLVVVSVLGTTVFASTEDFGAAGAQEETTYSLESMLEYAIEDEYLAYEEYELIIEELGAGRPFTNIINAEATHIEELEELYATLGLEVPVVDASELVVLPESIEAAISAGVDAELTNIAMYEIFLEQDLDEEVREVFEELKSASESHLEAFSKDRGDGNGVGTGIGNGAVAGQGNGNGTGTSKGTGASGGTGFGNKGANGSGTGTVVKAEGTRLYKNAEDCEDCEDCEL